MSYLLYVGVKDTMETTAKEMLFLSVLSRIIQATKLYHLSLWLPPCSWASLTIFQFQVKWFVYVYNFETVNIHKRTKLFHWIIFLSKNIKGFLRLCFLKPAAKKPKKTCFCYSLNDCNQNSNFHKGGRGKKKGSFLLCLSSKPCILLLCHKQMNIETDYIQYLPPGQVN